MSLLIKNGEIVTASERYVADIFCEDERLRESIAISLRHPARR